LLRTIADASGYLVTTSSPPPAASPKQSLDLPPLTRLAFMNVLERLGQ